jgi:SPP1 family predicted phage head-tail adaptor
MGAIGKMDRRVELVTPVNGKTPMGGPQKTFSHVCYAWASRVLMAEAEGQVNLRMGVNSRYRYLIHKRSGVKESMQLVDAGVTYNLVSVELTENKLFIELVAERVVE